MSKGIKKLYYSIGEVSDLIGVEKHVLRYWENKFGLLSPGKNSAGNRVYKEKDINIIKIIKHLLYEKKYTIEGANNVLKDLSSTEIKKYGQKGKIEKLEYNSEHKIEKYENVLKRIKKELQDILKVIEKRQ